MFRLIIATLVGMASLSAAAQMTPVGLWKTIDDNDGSVRSEVRIVENAGVVSGKIERNLDRNAKPGDRCTECKDDRKDQLVVGLEILRGLKKTEGKDMWESGTVIDPDNGKTYRASLTPIEGGAKLQLRGYIGFFYRTQIWVRAQ
jgi:uncharacterized protein (DUF2147 family)